MMAFMTTRMRDCFALTRYCSVISMLLLRYCLTVSASMAIAFPVMAQVVAPASDAPTPSPVNPTGSNSGEGIAPFESEGNTPQPSAPVSDPLTPTRDTPTPSRVNPTGTNSGEEITPFESEGNEPQPAMLPVSDPLTPYPNFLNPSGNLLNFPTQPSEVETTVRQPITLDEAIALALQNNRGLQASRLVLEQQQANLEAQRAALFPTLSTDFTFSRDSNEQTSLDAQGNLQTGNTSTNAQGNLQLGYDIYSGGERAARITQAELQVRQQRLEVERISEQTRFDATDRYYLLQNADAQVAIAQASVEDTTQSLRDARLLEQAGLGTRFDVLRAEGDLATANEALTRRISEQRTARRQLANVVSVGQHVELTAANEINPAGTWPSSLEETIVRAYKNRAELEQQLVQGEIREQDRYIAMSQVIPRVDFVARYGYQDDFDDETEVLENYSFLARIRWTFFDGGRAFAQARQANRQIDEANTEFARQRGDIRVQVEQAFFELIANRENISSTRVNVARFEEALRLARLRFQAGVGTQTDVINAQRDLADARGRFLDAVIGYNRSLNSLQRAVSNVPDDRLFELR